MDTLGTVLVACVDPAGVSAPDRAVILFSRATDTFPRFGHVLLGQSYRGADLRVRAREATGITVEIAQRRDGAFRTWVKADAPPRVVPMFAVVPRR
ncbi:hypothetical protein ABZ619_42065 [Streptomyces sp. NPDC007851]|uniref:hypothetical protein n=1 Tax=Streptomyces sp. NPDC007851 TaxID=3155008 RepID=UPI0033C3CE12